jgi:hypothetical protein
MDARDASEVKTRLRRCELMVDILEHVHKKLVPLRTSRKGKKYADIQKKWSDYDQDYRAVVDWLRLVVTPLFRNIDQASDETIFKQKSGFMRLWIFNQVADNYMTMFNQCSEKLKRLEEIYLN